MFLIDDLIISALGITAGSTAAATVTMATLGIGATVGMTVYQRSQAEKAASSSRKGQQAAAEEQAKAAARARAVAQAPISAEQMQKVIQQREIDSLVDLYAEQEQQGPRVYTLPTAQTSDPVTRINQAIHKILTGAA